MQKFPFTCVLQALAWYYDAYVRLLSPKAINIQPRESQGDALFENYQEQRRAEILSISICFTQLTAREQDAVHQWFLKETKISGGYGFYGILETGISKIGTEMLRRDGLLCCYRKFDGCKVGRCLRPRMRRTSTYNYQKYNCQKNDSIQKST